MVILTTVTGYDLLENDHHLPDSPITAGALHVHEVAVWVLDQPFQLVLPEQRTLVLVLRLSDG